MNEWLRSHPNRENSIKQAKSQIRSREQNIRISVEELRKKRVEIFKTKRNTCRQIDLAHMEMLSILEMNEEIRPNSFDKK